MKQITTRLQVERNHSDLNLLGACAIMWNKRQRQKRTIKLATMVREMEQHGKRKT